MPRPLLYTYRRCPYAMRARMASDLFQRCMRKLPAGTHVAF